LIRVALALCIYDSLNRNGSGGVLRPDLVLTSYGPYASGTCVDVFRLVFRAVREP
jgi:hypothetical protein